jgi:alpha-tubulin suppressor-like RCC1 family protein
LYDYKYKHFKINNMNKMISHTQFKARWYSYFQGILLFLCISLSRQAYATAPTVVTVPSNRVTYFGANFNVFVNPNNDTTTIAFEYGHTAAYGSTVNMPGTINGSSVLFKSLAVVGLAPGKTYHYRAKAENSSGISYGSDRILITGSNFFKSDKGYHTIAVGSNGIVYSFGFNDHGQLGDSSSTNRRTSLKVLKGAYGGTKYLGDNMNNPIISVTGGQDNSLALAADGTVYGFGDNYYGQLGDNTTITHRIVPIKVLKGDYNGTTYLGDNPNNPIIAIAAGRIHTLALAADGTLYAFGNNGYGQLGDNTQTDRAVPIRVLKGMYNGTTYLGDNVNNPIISIAAGTDHSIVMAADGTVYTFGGNMYGELGDSTNTMRKTPVKVLMGAYNGARYLGDDVGNPIVSIASGTAHNMALAADGTVYAFGNNNDGLLGDSTTTGRETPIRVLKGAYAGTTYLGDDSNNPISAIAAGPYHSMALAVDGTVYTYGYNYYTQLGDSTSKTRWVPVRVVKGAYSGAAYLGDSSNNPIVAISSGGTHSVAMAEDGTVYTFGWNAFCQLGDSSLKTRPKPVKAWGVGAKGVLDLIDNCTTNAGKDKTICSGDLVAIGSTAASGHSYKWSSSPNGYSSKTSFTYASPTSNTIYILKDLTIGSGCVAIDSVYINVNPMPVANVGSDTTICNGSSITIGASPIAGNTYSWISKPNGFTSTSSNPSVNPTTSTIYILTEEITATGCSKSDTVSVTVNNITDTALNVIACNNYMFKGNLLSSSGVYYDSLTNISGCDSVITLNLTINKSVTKNLTITSCNSYVFKGNSLTKTGIYYDSLTNAGGCDSLVILDLTINNSKDSSISPTACNSYTFNGKTYTSSGIYIDTITNAAGCDSVVTLNITINTVNNAVSQSNTILTAVQTGATYQWLDCKTGYSAISGATNQSYTATANGDYAVAVTLSGCSDTSACVTVSSIGISHVVKSGSDSYRGEGLVVYPNPNNGEFTIESSGKGVYTIVNELGQVMQTILLNDANKYTMNIGNRSAGIYFIVGFNSGQMTRQKVVVMK